MPHAISPIPTVTLDSAPGTTTFLKVVVTNAGQPGPTSAASGVVEVTFAGETVSAPLEVQFATGPAGPPTASIDLGGATGVTASVGVASQIGTDRYEIPVTLTVV